MALSNIGVFSKKVILVYVITGKMLKTKAKYLCL